MTNPGTENPNTAKPMTARSIHEPTRHAAMTPSGTASRTEMSSVISVSDERRLQALADQLRDRMRGEDRVAEIAAQQLADPGEELDQQRLVESQLGADLRDILGASRDRRR